ncbi:four helix bundle protein [Candidatus Curtissbacteria bacterium]|nr:four helix bundle protein [Candidatus Curtissbacteria bacterium]
MQNDNLNFKINFKKRLYNFVLKLIRFIDKLPKDNTSRVIGDQLIRSGTSILGNYIEASASSSRKDFTNYFNHSLKSSNESKLWVTLIRDTGRSNKNDAAWLLKELDEFSKIFATSILTLKGKK